MHICFLDIDGTMVATGGAGQAAFVVTLAKDFGIPDATSNGISFAGRSDRAISMDLFALHGIEPSAENWQRFAAAYVERLSEVLKLHDGRVLPGVVSLLEQLAERGDVALGLLTGNVREAARRKLCHYRLWDWFAFGGFGDDHTDRNDIAAAALAAARLHLNSRADAGVLAATGDESSADRIVVIGDTLNDIRCARSIGARCVAVPTGQTSVDALRSGEPDVVVDTLEDAAAVMRLFN